MFIISTSIWMTGDSSIFIVITVMIAIITSVAGSQCFLGSITDYISIMYWKVPPTVVSTTQSCCIRCVVSQLATHYFSISSIPSIITDCAPASFRKHLHSPLPGVETIDQSDVSLTLIITIT
jgi:hypothetical protein